MSFYAKSVWNDIGLDFNANLTSLYLAAMKKIFERDFFSKYLIYFVNVSFGCMISEVFQQFLTGVKNVEKIGVMINVAF